MPVQCPECGRFLRNEFVTGLSGGAAACPRCATTLTATMFTVSGAGVSPEARPVMRTDPPGQSVRPPDLPARDPHDIDEIDVLAGWDIPTTGSFKREADVVDLAGWRRDQQGFPVDAAVLAGSGIAGAVLGALLSRDHRGVGATVGALAGLGAASAGRQIWRLPD